MTKRDTEQQQAMLDAHQMPVNISESIELSTIGGDTLRVVSRRRIGGDSSPVLRKTVTMYPLEPETAE